LLVDCNSKDYLQKAKRGELVPSGQTQVRSINGQAGVAIVKGAKGTSKKMRISNGNSDWRGITMSGE
jgi:hypothetical protein